MRSMTSRREKYAIAPMSFTASRTVFGRCSSTQRPRWTCIALMFCTPHAYRVAAGTSAMTEIASHTTTATVPIQVLRRGPEGARSWTSSSRPQLGELRFGRVGDRADCVSPIPSRPRAPKATASVSITSGRRWIE